MKRKILLFNYFISKCLEREKELLKTDDFKTLMLGLITARASIFHRTASGCSTEMGYIIRPKFLQELFVFLCLDAMEHGDNLLEPFNFSKTHTFSYLHWGKGDFEDIELTAYLEKAYLEVNQLTEDEKAMYSQIITPLPKVFQSPYYGSVRIRRVTLEKLTVSSKDKYTEMIDRAFERLSRCENFVGMFLLDGKYDLYGMSTPYCQYI